MRKHLSILILIISVAVLTACQSNAGNVSQSIEKDIEIDIGQSERFSEEEILAAIDTAKDGIVNYSESAFTKLWYDEEKSEETYNSQKQRYEEDGIYLDDFIVIMSEFETGEVEEGSPLNPNSTYEDYMWILEREDSTSEWELFERGY